MNRFDKSKVENLAEWLEIATKGLVPASKERIALEIETHYSEALAAHLTQGDPKQVAQANALVDLGDPKVAGKRFQKKHLTEWEVNRLWEKQIQAGSFVLLLCHYLVFAFGYYCFSIMIGPIAGLSKFRLFLILIGFALPGAILPTIAFLKVRTRLISPGVASLPLMQFLWHTAIGLCVVPCFLNLEKTRDLISSICIISSTISFNLSLGAFFWLRIWNKIRKAGGDGTGAPRPV